MSAPRRYTRRGILTVLALLAAFAVVGLIRLHQLVPTLPELSGWFLAPVAVSCALGVLLLLEMRRVEHVQAARSDSEQRFRMAVEAARCGIWEWDLAADKI